MLLEADTLIYDNDDDTVTAVGGVRIDYGGNKLVAERVTYDRDIAPAGRQRQRRRSSTRTAPTIYSDEIDITDDFARRLRQRAARRDRRQDLFRGRKRRAARAASSRPSTTASTRPASPARNSRTRRRSGASRPSKIIWNGKAKTVRFENSRFEFFGMPIGHLPAFEIADPTVKRKIRLPVPGHRLQERTRLRRRRSLLFRAVADLRPDGHRHRSTPSRASSREAEWRQRFNNGEYSIKIAGINQADPDAFELNTVDSGPPGRPEPAARHGRHQGRVRDQSALGRSAGTFSSRPTRTSPTPTASMATTSCVHRSEVYLTGLNDRNYLRPARHALRGSGRASSTSIPSRPQRQAALGAAELRLFVYAGRAGVRRRAQFRRQRPRHQPRPNWIDDRSTAPTRRAVRGIEGDVEPR